MCHTQNNVEYLKNILAFITTKNKKYIDTKQSNKRNNQNTKDKRQDYNMKFIWKLFLI